MSPPIWFLDIDGVINSIGMPVEGDGVDVSSYRRIDVTTSEDITWPIHYSPVVVDFINEMHRSELAEVRWLTTWQQDARLSFAPAVGLDDFFAYDEPEELQHDWWKESVVRTTLAAEPDRSFVWTDDDLDTRVRESVASDHPVRSLLICPACRPGLTHHEMDRIRTHLEAS